MARNRRHAPASSPRLGRITSRRCRPLWPLIQPLEVRTLLSAFYDLTTIATTAGGSFTRFGDLVSSNSLGEVAFVGSTSASPFGGDGLYVQKIGTSQPVNINPTFSGHDDRSFGRTAAINDQGVVTARDQVATDPPQFLVRRWSSRTADANIILSRVPTNDPTSPDNQLSLLGGYTDIDQAGNIVFVSASADSAYRSVQYVSHDNLGLDTYKTLEVMPGGAKPSPRPQLTDLGRVLYYSTDGNAIKLVDTTTARATVIASAGVGGFRRLGPAPGVSSDGEVVVFEGDRGQGPGIFAAYKTGGKFRVVRIAGEGLDSFVAFDTTSAVQVGGGNNGVDARGVTIAFVGTRVGHGSGLYTARLSFFGRSEADYDPTAVQSTLVSGVAPVVELLDILPDGRKVDQVKFWHGIDQIHRGCLSFWVQATDGTQEILQADPVQVVRLQFAPSGARLSGRSAATLDLLKYVGISDLGVTGTMKDALAQVGLPMSATAYDALQTDVVKAVQKAFSDIGTRVSVVGLPGEAPPSYIPEPVLDDSGHAVMAGGSAVLSGAYKTIFVGLVPEGGKETLGVASAPPEVTNSSLDFYNQVMDSTALVFVNQIFSPDVFPGRPIASLKYDVQVRAIASTIAHEMGHLFGLYHLDEVFQAEIMHAATVIGEFDSTEGFETNPLPVQQDEGGTLSQVSESSAGRLHFSLNEASGTAPNPALFQVEDANVRAKLGVASTSSLTVKHLLVGIKSAGGDTAPTFADLGGGGLATLLNGAKILVAPGDTLLVVGSTDGVNPDVIGVAQGQEGAQTSLSLSVLGLMGDSRLAAPVSGVGAALHLYQLTTEGPVDLGLATIATTPVNHAPTLALLDNQVASVGATVHFTAAATDPDAGQTLSYSLDAGAPTGTAIDPLTGVFAWTPTAAQGGQINAITVRATDSGTPAQTASQTITINVSNRLQVLGLTYLSAPRPGPLQVAVDFNQALQPASAQAVSLYKLVSDGGLSLPIQSATYSDSGTQHRVVLTVAAGTPVRPDIYHVTIDGTGLISTAGDLGAVKGDQLWVEATEDNALKSIVIAPDGSPDVGDIINFGYSPPKTVLASDLTGDGTTDLVVATHTFRNNFTQTVSNAEPILLLKGRGDGTYDPPVPLVAGGNFFEQSVQVADWNNDASPDLVIGGDSLDASGVYKHEYLVLLNDGHGHFSDAPDTPIPLPSYADGGYSPFTVTSVVDLDGDGLPEIVHSGYSPDGQSVLEVIGKDPFVGYSALAQMKTGQSGLVSPAELYFADLNGDGKKDIIARHQGYYASLPGITVNLSTPTGYAPGQKILNPAGPPLTVVMGDFTGDGLLDVATTFSAYDNSLGVNDGDVIQILKGDGHGGFAAQPLILLNHLDISIAAAGDVNHDGLTDFVLIDSPGTGQIGTFSFDYVTELSSWTWLADGRGGFRPSTTAPIPLATTDQSTPVSIRLSDLDRDGLLDLVLGSDASGQVRLAYNDGTGTMRPSAAVLPTVGIGPPRSSIDVKTSHQVFADFNNDGRVDFVTVENGSLVQLYLGIPGGGFAPGTGTLPSASLGAITWVRSGDLNNDGLPDLIISNNGEYAQILLGRGDGTFRQDAPLFHAEGLQIGGVTLGDVNGDGKLDAVITLGGQAGFAVAFGDGTGKLTYNANTSIPFVLPYPNLPYDVFAMLADFDGDGKLDILVPNCLQNESTHTLTIYHGRGNGTFTPGAVVDQGPGHPDTRFLTGDFNNDGKLDIVGYEPLYGPSTVHFYLGNGTGGYQKAPSLDLPIAIGPASSFQLGPFSLVAGDFNGDGKLDLAAGFLSDVHITEDGILLFLGYGNGRFAAPMDVATGAVSIGLTVVSRAERLEAGTFAVTDRAPTAADDSGSVNAGSSLQLPVLANDSDPDQEPLNLTGVDSPTHGVAHVIYATPGDPSTGSIVYSPFVGFTGVDQFNYTITDAAGASASAVVRITVLAVLPQQVHFSTPVLSIGEAGGSVSITVSREGGSDGTVSVNYATGGGTATSGSDYDATSGTLTFEPGVVSKSFLVPIRDDLTIEGDETFGVTLTSPLGGATLGTPATTTVTIIDNDSPAGVHPGTLQFHASSASASEAAIFVAITVDRLDGSDGTVSVNFATGGGTATSGSDYDATSGTLTFGPGDVSKSLFVLIRDDLLIEGDETFGVTLTSPIGGATLGTPATTTVTIIDNDSPVGLHPGMLQFHASSASASEAAGSVAITVDRVGGSDGAVSVIYVISAGTIAGAANFVATAGTLQFPAGVTSQVIIVALIDDTQFDGTDTAILSLSVPTGGATIGLPPSMTLAITDNDRPAPRPSTLQFSLGSTTSDEDRGSAVLTILRTGGSDGVVTVQVATSGGDAVPGVNYTAVRQTVIFAAGETTKTVLIPILHDGAFAADRSVVLTLSSPSAGATLGPLAAASLIIRNIDPPTVVNVPLVTLGGVRTVADKHKNVTQVVISLSGAVDSARAASITEYRLATAGKKGSFDAKGFKTIKLRSATYNPSANTVTLTLAKPLKLSKTVQLRIDGSPSGLTDSLGRPIDGNRDGQAGGNAVALLGKRGVTISRLGSKGLTSKSTAIVDFLLDRGDLNGLVRQAHRKTR